LFRMQCTLRLLVDLRESITIFHDFGIFDPFVKVFRAFPRAKSDVVGGL